MGRRRTRHPKRNQLCVRLTDRELELLRAYAKHRNYLSEVDAIRSMIDGLEDFLARQQAKQDAKEQHQSAPEPSSSEGDSGLPTPGKSEPIDAPIDGDNDVGDVDNDAPPPVGDFGGRPSWGLPGMTEE